MSLDTTKKPAKKAVKKPAKKVIEKGTWKAVTRTSLETSLLRYKAFNLITAAINIRTKPVRRSMTITLENAELDHSRNLIVLANEILKELGEELYIDAT